MSVKSICKLSCIPIQVPEYAQIRSSIPAYASVFLINASVQEGSGLWPVTAAIHRHSASVVVTPEDAVPASLHICIRLSPETEIYRAAGSVVTGS